MKLEPPLNQYLTGSNPSHSSLNDLSKHVKAWSQDEIIELLTSAGCINEGKPTRDAATRGIIDLCERKVLWNLLETKKALIAQDRVETLKKANLEAARKRDNSGEPRFVDLGTIGTYFGVSNIVIGKWLDELGLRGKPQMKLNSSGAVDMLDMANQAKQKQANGFIGKEPTEKALNAGIARKLTVTNSKKKEIEITQWNLDLCKAVFLKAGHKENHEARLKGTGKNSDVKVITADDRARELYLKWKGFMNKGDKVNADKVFDKQPKVILLKVEGLMNKPGFLVK